MSIPLIFNDDSSTKSPNSYMCPSYKEGVPNPVALASREMKMKQERHMVKMCGCVVGGHGQSDGGSEANISRTNGL